MSIQIWQHRNSGNQYVVEVGDDGLVSIAEMVLANNVYAGVTETVEAGEDYWADNPDASKQLAHWINDTTDDYRVVWPYQSA